MNRPTFYDPIKVKVSRHFDADLINKIVNHPDVYQWVHGAVEGELDLSLLIQDHNHHLAMGSHGGILFHCQSPGLYEAHTQVLPDHRGEWAVDMTRAALRYAFSSTDAVEIFTRVPKGNLGARALVKNIGGVLEFRRRDGWVKDGVSIPADIYTMKVQDWVRTSPGLVERGKWFDTKLRQELSAHKVSLPLIDEEDYFRYSGAAVEMMLGGQAHKAVVLYNRYAAMAGRPPISLLTSSSALVDIGQGIIIKPRYNDFWVVSCR